MLYSLGIISSPDPQAINEVTQFAGTSLSPERSHIPMQDASYERHIREVMALEAQLRGVGFNWYDVEGSHLYHALADSLREKS